MSDLLSYETRGTGPGLVLVHGTGSTGLGSWGTVLDRLSAEHTVVLPDLPGSGDSPLPDGPLDIDTVADRIAATARAAGLDEFVVAGASLGAPLAIKVAARHPRRARGLATVVGYARLRTTLRLNLELWAALHARGGRELGTFLTGLTFSEEYLAALPPEAVGQIAQRFGGPPTPGTAAQIAFTLGIDVRDELAAVRVPTLVVAATGDRFVAPEHSAEIAAGIAGARLVRVTGGHASVFEDPGQTADALLGFLDGLG
ncbi:alpha/beta fold hydrolase [Streptomyces sp. NPDC058319]|uniref:alpha/beta fold hydrolase n=1 Tax=unclassified Streptomyces TaxID=2593676 RepID=UPI0036EC3063